MTDTTITIIGNLTADPELRFTQSGAAVASFTVASTPRVKDGDQWKDGEALFLNCSVWREQAESVAESLTKGTRVIVTGKLKSRSYQTKDGDKRTVIEVEVEEVGPSLRFGDKRAQPARQQPARQPIRSQRPPADPWATSIEEPAF